MTNLAVSNCTSSWTCSCGKLSTGFTETEDTLCLCPVQQFSHVAMSWKMLFWKPYIGLVLVIVGFTVHKHNIGYIALRTLSKVQTSWRIRFVWNTLWMWSVGMVPFYNMWESPCPIDTVNDVQGYSGPILTPGNTWGALLFSVFRGVAVLFATLVLLACLEGYFQWW